MQHALKDQHRIRELLKDDAVLLLIQVILYILHMENHVGLKLMTVLFTDGLSNAVKGLTFAQLNSVGAHIEAFFTKIETIINCQILGDDFTLHQWLCP